MTVFRFYDAIWLEYVQHNITYLSTYGLPLIRFMQSTDLTISINSFKNVLWSPISAMESISLI